MKMPHCNYNGPIGSAKKWDKAAKIITDANQWYDGRCPFCNQKMPLRPVEMPPEEVKRRDDLLKTIPTLLKTNEGS
jgi:hypothetical protein